MSHDGEADPAWGAPTSPPRMQSKTEVRSRRARTEVARSWSRRRDLGRMAGFMSSRDQTHAPDLRVLGSLTQPGGHRADSPRSRAALLNGYCVLGDETVLRCSGTVSESG